MPQFLISKKSIEADLAILNSQESHHLTRVLRKKAGDSITLSDGEGNQFEGEIFELEPVVKIKIRSVLKEEKNTRSIILCSAIIKGPRMDWVIEKATELGVTHLMPFVSERGVVKIKNSAEGLSKIKRWQKIAEAAVKQSGRAQTPQIGPVLSWKELLEHHQHFEGMKILFHPHSKQIHPLPLKNILIAIGPEGGFSPTELGLAQQHDFDFYSFGTNILRAETAALAALSLTLYV